MVLLYIFVNLTHTDAADDCLPNVGENGPLTSVTLIVKTWESRSSNYHFDDPEITSTDTRTIPKSSQVSTVSGANVRFYGKELCVAVTMITEKERSDGSVERSSSCGKSCFGVGGGTRLQFYSGTFGRPTSTNPPCCFSGSIKSLEFSIPAPPTTPPPSLTCVKCGASDDCVSESSTQTCNSGEKCFTLKLQREDTDEVVTVKGCSHELRYWGEKLDCDYECKSNVQLWPDRRVYHHSVCVSCCSGNKCNVDRDDSEVSSFANSNGNNFLAAIFAFFSLIYAMM